MVERSKVGDEFRGKISKRQPLEQRMYPEYFAGRFTAEDCTVVFYTRINALIDDSTILLNLGAGRGSNITNDSSPFRRKIQDFSNRVTRLIGVDIDRAVLENPYLDERYVIPGSGEIPLPDRSVDIIVADHVLEHVENPRVFAREIERILKPGGWFCARTPVKWGYIGIGARLFPNAFHVGLLRRLQPGRQPEDVFPTHYRLNTVSALNHYFPRDQWRNCSYGFNGVPGYTADNLILFMIIRFWCWIMPRMLSAKYHVFLQKQ